MENEGIPNEHKPQIISSGLHFLRCISECYGADKGIELWEQISKVLDPNVKGEIFFAMLTGKYHTKIVLRGVSPIRDSGPVACIKKLREVTGTLGLKEAKDIYDSLAQNTRYPSSSPKSVTITVGEEIYTDAVQELLAVGFII